MIAQYYRTKFAEALLAGTVKAEEVRANHMEDALSATCIKTLGTATFEGETSQNPGLNYAWGHAEVQLRKHRNKEQTTLHLFFSSRCGKSLWLRRNSA